MLSRGLRLLTALSEHPGGLGVSAAGRAARLPVSSAHRLLAVLVGEGYVIHDPVARRYALGMRALELARGFNRSPAGFQAAFEPMRRLATGTGLTAIAGILDGDDVLLVLTAEGSQHLRLRSAEGTRNPWYATALGKVLVAARPGPERARLLASRLLPVTAHTGTDPEALKAELALTAERGWAEVEQENEIGVRSVAVPVPGADGGTPALAVSLGAAVVLTSREELRGFVDDLRSTAEEIAARLG